MDSQGALKFQDHLHCIHRQVRGHPHHRLYHSTALTSRGRGLCPGAGGGGGRRGGALCSGWTPSPENEPGDATTHTWRLGNYDSARLGRGASIDDREEGRQKEERALVSNKGQVKQGGSSLLPAIPPSIPHPAQLRQGHSTLAGGRKRKGEDLAGQDLTLHRHTKARGPTTLRANDAKEPTLLPGEMDTALCASACFHLHSARERGDTTIPRLSHCREGEEPPRCTGRALLDWDNTSPSTVAPPTHSQGENTEHTPVESFPEGSAETNGPHQVCTCPMDFKPARIRAHPPPPSPPPLPRTPTTTTSEGTRCRQEQSTPAPRVPVVLPLPRGLAPLGPAPEPLGPLRDNHATRGDMRVPVPPRALNQCPERARLLPEKTRMGTGPQVRRHKQGPREAEMEPRIHTHPFGCPHMYRPSAHEKPRRGERHHLRATPQAWMALGPPWAFFDPQRAEGEATLARVVGISGATVPSSGSFLSTASKPCLWIPVGLVHSEDSRWGWGWGRPTPEHRQGKVRERKEVVGAELAHPGAPGCQAGRASQPWGRGLGSRHLPIQGVRPETLPSLRDPGPPVGSRGNPGPVAAAPNVDRGERGRRRPPCQGQHSADRTENFPISVWSRSQTRKRNVGGPHIPSSSSTSGSACVSFTFAPATEGPHEALPVPYHTGYPDPLGTGYNWANISTLRWTSPFPPSISGSGSGSGRHGHGHAAARGRLGPRGASLVVDDRVLLFGGTPEIFSTGPKPGGHTETTWGQGTSQIREARPWPQGRALPTFGRLPSVKEGAGGGCQQPSKRGESQVECVEGGVQPGDLFLEFEASPGTLPPNHQHHRYSTRPRKPADPQAGTSHRRACSRRGPWGQSGLEGRSCARVCTWETSWMRGGDRGGGGGGRARARPFAQSNEHRATGSRPGEPGLNGSQGLLSHAEVRLGASSGQSRSLQRHGPGVRSARLLSSLGTGHDRLCQNSDTPGNGRNSWLRRRAPSQCLLVLRAPRSPLDSDCEPSLGLGPPWHWVARLTVIPSWTEKRHWAGLATAANGSTTLAGLNAAQRGFGGLGLQPDLLLLPGEGARTRPKARGPGQPRAALAGLGSNPAASSSPAQTWRPPESRSLHSSTLQARHRRRGAGGGVVGGGRDGGRAPSPASGHTSCPFAGGALDFPGHGPGPCSRLYAPATPPQEGTAQGARGWRLAALRKARCLNILATLAGRGTGGRLKPLYATLSGLLPSPQKSEDSPIEAPSSGPAAVSLAIGSQAEDLGKHTDHIRPCLARHNLTGHPVSSASPFPNVQPAQPLNNPARAPSHGLPGLGEVLRRRGEEQAYGAPALTAQKAKGLTGLDLLKGSPTACAPLGLRPRLLVGEVGGRMITSLAVKLHRSWRPIWVPVAGAHAPGPGSGPIPLHSPRFHVPIARMYTDDPHARPSISSFPLHNHDLPREPFSATAENSGLVHQCPPAAGNLPWEDGPTSPMMSLLHLLPALPPLQREREPNALHSVRDRHAAGNLDSVFGDYSYQLPGTKNFRGKQGVKINRTRALTGRTVSGQTWIIPPPTTNLSSRFKPQSSPPRLWTRGTPAPSTATGKADPPLTGSSYDGLLHCTDFPGTRPGPGPGGGGGELPHSFAPGGRRAGKRTPVTPPRHGAWVTTNLHASARGASIDDREEGRQRRREGPSETRQAPPAPPFPPASRTPPQLRQGHSTLAGGRKRKGEDLAGQDLTLHRHTKARGPTTLRANERKRAYIATSAREDKALCASACFHLIQARERAHTTIPLVSHCREGVARRRHKASALTGIIHLPPRWHLQRTTGEKYEKERSIFPEGSAELMALTKVRICVDGDTELCTCPMDFKPARIRAHPPPPPPLHCPGPLPPQPPEGTRGRQEQSTQLPGPCQFLPLSPWPSPSGLSGALAVEVAGGRAGERQPRNKEGTCGAPCTSSLNQCPGELGFCLRKPVWVPVPKCADINRSEAEMEPRIHTHPFGCPHMYRPLPTRSPEGERDTTSAQHPSRPGLDGLGPPWAFDHTRAEGEATLARVVGISGATVPSSGSFLSTASKPCLWIPVGLVHSEDSRWGWGWGRPTPEHRQGKVRERKEVVGASRHPGAPGCQAGRAPSLGGVASAAAMFRNQELKLPHPGRPAPETLPSLRDPGPPVGSRGNPGPVAAAPNVDRGERGRRRPPCQGQHSADRTENFPISVWSRSQTRKRNFQLHFRFGVCFVYFCARHRGSGCHAPQDPMRPFVPYHTGYPDPLGTGYNWANISTLRWTSPFPPSISGSGSGSGSGTGTGTGTLQPGDALVLGGPPSSWTTRVLLFGGTPEIFPTGPKPGGHTETTWGQGTSQIREARPWPQGRALPTFGRLPSVKEGAGGGCQQPSKRGESQVECVEGGVQPGDLFLEFEASPGTLPPNHQHHRYSHPRPRKPADPQAGTSHRRACSRRGPWGQSGSRRNGRVPGVCTWETSWMRVQQRWALGSVLRPLLDFPAGLRPQAQGHRVKTWRARAEWKPGPFLLIAEVRLGASSGQSRRVRSARLLSCAVLSRRWDTTGLCQNPGHPGKWQKFLAQEKGSFCSVSLVLRAPFPSGLRLRALAGPRAPLALGSQAPHRHWAGLRHCCQWQHNSGWAQRGPERLRGPWACPGRTCSYSQGKGHARGQKPAAPGQPRAAPGLAWAPTEQLPLVPPRHGGRQSPGASTSSTLQARHRRRGAGWGGVWGDGTGAERLPPVPVSGASKASGHTSCPFAGGALDFPGHGPGPCSRLYAPATPPQEGTAQGPRGWRLADLFLLMAASHQKQQPASPHKVPQHLGHFGGTGDGGRGTGGRLKPLYATLSGLVSEGSSQAAFTTRKRVLAHRGTQHRPSGHHVNGEERKEGEGTGDPSSCLPPSGHRETLRGQALLGRSPHTRQGTELRRRHNPGALAQPASPRRHTPARPTQRPLGPTRPPLACVARPAQAAQAPEDREGPRTTKATGRSPDPGLASPASGKGRERRGRRLGGPTWLRPRAARGDPGRSDPRAGAGGTQLRPPPAPATASPPHVVRVSSETPGRWGASEGRRGWESGFLSVGPAQGRGWDLLRRGELGKGGDEASRLSPSALKYQFVPPPLWAADSLQQQAFPAPGYLPLFANDLLVTSEVAFGVGVGGCCRGYPHRLGGWRCAGSQGVTATCSRPSGHHVNGEERKEGEGTGDPSSCLPPSGHRETLRGQALLGRSPHTRQGTELRRRHNPGALAQPASPRRHTPARPTQRPLGPTRPPLACVARPAQAAQAPEDREGPRTTKATGRSPDPGLASPASGKGRERRGRRLGGPTWLRPRAARGDPGRSDPRAGAGGTQLRPPPAPATASPPHVVRVSSETPGRWGASEGRRGWESGFLSVGPAQGRGWDLLRRGELGKGGDEASRLSPSALKYQFVPPPLWAADSLQQQAFPAPGYLPLFANDLLVTSEVAFGGVSTPPRWVEVCWVPRSHSDLQMMGVKLGLVSSQYLVPCGRV
ncbi:hypothetical protein Cadr_000002834 [Camelus dromedarius]|uniref:Uncharacterized protein n=1 Tax=Camelus dromedarius TaxID=9838 RepID=A0A5N4C1H0_CAMDR|nr:hypothetical protein Cadr_000002834 [Camelus dromedarius]